VGCQEKERMIVLVIGGTGSLGEALLPKLIADPAISRIRVLSRNEHKQIWLNETLQSPKLDWFIGDVRDSERVWLASRNVDCVYHLAAIKSIDKAEYNPNEAIMTNIEGTRNVIDACLKNHVKQAVFTSTDKAADPYNIYGASKLVAEKLWIASNNYSTKDGTNFVAVRYGNVLGSNGSVLQKWFKTAHEKKEIYVTNTEMTRFWMTLDAASDLVIKAAALDQRKVTIIPKLKAATMAVFARCFVNAVGEQLGQIAIKNMAARGGEKLHETLISHNEGSQCLLQNDNYHVYRYGDDILVNGLSVKRLDSETAPTWHVDDLTQHIKEVLYGV
jgi:UDP-N-acetylglucosamine 4,6-dehydratase